MPAPFLLSSCFLIRACCSASFLASFSFLTFSSKIFFASWSFYFRSASCFFRWISSFICFSSWILDELSRVCCTKLPSDNFWLIWSNIDRCCCSCSLIFFWSYRNLSWFLNFLFASRPWLSRVSLVFEMVWFLAVAFKAASFAISRRCLCLTFIMVNCSRSRLVFSRRSIMLLTPTLSLFL